LADTIAITIIIAINSIIISPLQERFLSGDDILDSE
jgi:hypothetical protein